MFGFFKRKIARQLAHSIGQMINMLSVGMESGPETPERMLRKLASQTKDERMGDTRVLWALVPMTPREKLPVSLTMQPDGKQTIIVDGGEIYAGFSLSCTIPVRVMVIELKPDAFRHITPGARALYAACKRMPNTIEGSRGNEPGAPAGHPFRRWRAPRLLTRRSRSR